MSPRNATEIGQRRTYAVPGSPEPLTSVTTYLKAYPKEWLGAWAAKMTAHSAIDGIRDAEWDGKAAIATWAEQDYAAHCETTTHKERHRRHCDYTPSAAGWLKGSPWRIRDDAAGHGTDLHAYLEARVTENQDFDYLPETPAAIAVEEFMETYRPKPLYVEAQIANLEYHYAGSLDLIAEIYGRTGLIDLKTAGTLGAEMRLQLAAYRNGEVIFEDDRIVGPVPKVDFCAVLWIPRDAPEKWQFIEVDADVPEFEMFQHVQAVYRYHSTNKNIGGELILPQTEAA